MHDLDEKKVKQKNHANGLAEEHLRLHDSIFCLTLSIKKCQSKSALLNDQKNFHSAPTTLHNMATLHGFKMIAIIYPTFAVNN